MSNLDPYTRDRSFDPVLLRKFRVLRKFRPAALGSFLAKVLGPAERRRIVLLENGLRIYADPFTQLGYAILHEGCPEPETEQVFRRHVRPGDIVLDVGANEGYFSALAGTLVGSQGLVIAVEPQSELTDLIEVNLRLNHVTHFRIFRNALGGDDGAGGVLNLWPIANRGASSIVRRYRFSISTEAFTFVSVDRILSECGVVSFDFVKIDVEGFEEEVVRVLRPMLERRRIGRLFVDYHTSILGVRSIDPRDIHNEILACGYAPVSGGTSPPQSYVLYADGSNLSDTDVKHHAG